MAASAHGRDVEDLERARAGEVAAGDVAHGVAARLAARQADRRASRRSTSGVCASSTKWNWTFWRVVRWPQPREYVSAMLASISSCSGVDPAVRDLHPHHLVGAALALAVDALVQAERRGTRRRRARPRGTARRRPRTGRSRRRLRGRGVGPEFGEVDAIGAPQHGSEGGPGRGGTRRGSGREPEVGAVSEPGAPGRARHISSSHLMGGAALSDAGGAVGPDHGVSVRRPGVEMPAFRSGINPTGMIEINRRSVPGLGDGGCDRTSSSRDPADADVGAVPAHAARRPGRRRDRQPPPAGAGRLHPPGGLGHLLVAAAREPGAAAVEQIVREEMDARRARRRRSCRSPSRSSSGQRTGRDAAYGPMMFRLRGPQGDRASACRRPPRR